MSTWNRLTVSAARRTLANMPKPRNPRGKEHTRLDIRLKDQDERSLLDDAADAMGDKYTSEWARRVLVLEARRVVGERNWRRRR